MIKVIRKDSVYHVGFMDILQKSGDSNEGSGLSVSNCPDAWRCIAGCLGPCYLLSKKRSQFLDFYKLSRNDEASIYVWGTDNGYCAETDLFRVSYYDEEYDNEYYLLFEDEAKAASEAEERDTEYSREQGYIGTQKLRDEAICPHLAPAATLEILTTVYADKVLGLDGVWWNEELDVYRLSAPRGVIFNSRLPEWTVTKTE